MRDGVDVDLGLALYLSLASLEARGLLADAYVLMDAVEVGATPAQIAALVDEHMTTVLPYTYGAPVEDADTVRDQFVRVATVRASGGGGAVRNSLLGGSGGRQGSHWRVGWRGEVTTLADAALVERRTSMAEAIVESLATAEVETYTEGWEDGWVSVRVDDPEALTAAHQRWVEADVEVRRRQDGDDQ